MARPSVGDRLAGRYQIRAMTAERPTGLLLRGYDEQIGVEVALRLIDAELLVDERERRAFVQRAARARALQHPNLIRLYDVLVDNDAVFLVMQWAPGERLSRRLQAGPLSLAEARLVIRRAAAGIAHAHQHGVVLGNVRADTVMLYPDGLKLTNVGIGPALPRQRFLEAMKDKGALETLAPELRAGQDPDERSDVYALAALARTLLEREAEPSAPSLTDAVRPILDRALADAPAARMRDPEAFARELEAAFEGKSARTAGPSVPTGSDTERVSKLEIADLLATEERPALESREHGTELELERHTDSQSALTNAQARRPREKGESLELDLSDLVEVKVGVGVGDGETSPVPRVSQSEMFAPDVTDVGYRSPVQMPQPLESGGFASMHTPSMGERPLPKPRTAVPVAARPSGESTIASVPSTAVITSAAPLSPAKPASTAPVPLAKPSVPTRRGFAPLDEHEDSTNRVPRIEIDQGPLPHGVAPPPPIAEPLPATDQYEPGLSPDGSAHRRTMAFLLIVGVGLGAIGAVALWYYSTDSGLRPLGPIVVAKGTPDPTPSPSTSPSTSPTPTPLPSTSPAPTPSPAPTVVATGPCPLGMVQLSGAHPYCIDLYEYPGGHTIPRTQVSLADASQVCTSRGLRLCTDAEWEQACRGPGAASYPYGQSYDPQRCNTGGRATSVVQPAGADARCRSAAGAYDMSGNVAEWTASGAVRGGSAHGSAADARCSHSVKGAAPAGSAEVGFRCCGDSR